MQTDTNTMKDPLACGACGGELHSGMINTPGPVHCPSCGARMRVLAFPALTKGVSPGKAGDLLVSEEESGCFYHPDKKAVVPCSSCGRYLCALCDVEMNTHHLCPPCIESGKSGTISENRVTHCVRYDKIAFYLSVFPILIFPFFFFSLITAPSAMFVAIRYWKAPAGLVSGSKIRLAASILIAVLQLVAWGVYLSFFISNRDL